MTVVLQNPYCTVEDVQRETQNTNADVVAKFVASINQSSRWIESHTARDFLFHDYSTTPLVVEERWAAHNKIYLPWPILTLTNIERTDEFGNVTTMDVADYRTLTSYGSIGGVIESSLRWFTPDRYSTPGLLPQKSYKMKPQVKLYGTFGYRLPVASDVTLAPNQTFVASQWPSPVIPAEISVGCAVLAAVRSGLARKDIIGFDGQKTSATVKTVPKETMDGINRFRRLIL